MSDSTHSTKAAPEEKPFPWGCLRSFLIMGVMLFILAGIAIGPSPTGIRQVPQSVAMQSARQIGLMMFAYSNDHEQQYPDGKSSTEVFQKLLDENYASDPAAFYLPLPGKIKPVAGQKLKPENIGFDVTSGIDSSSPDELPVVFEAGFKVTYVSGGRATLISKGSLSIFATSAELRTWSEWWNGKPPQHPLDPLSGIAVSYKSNSARFMKAYQAVTPDGSTSVPPVYKPDTSIDNFIAPTYKPDGKTYRQLTPDGVLPDH